MMRNFKFNNDNMVSKIQTANDRRTVFDAPAFEKNMKQTISYVKSYDKQLKDYKETYNEYKESLEHRIDQETDHNLRVMEGKFERQKNEFYSALGELKKNISDTLQQFDDGLHKLYTQVRCCECIIKETGIQQLISS